MIKKSQRELIYANPEMFIGKYWNGSKWDNQALEVLIMLIIRQAVDSNTFNASSLLRVELKSKDMIIITDDGIGLPVSPPSNIGNSNTSALVRSLEWYIPTGELTKEFYSEYGFLGDLARLLNILSESLRIDTVRQGQVYTVSCSRGVIISPLQKSDNSILNQGTRISFKPDSDIFPSPVFNEEFLRMGLNELASKFSQITFEFIAVDTD